MFVPKYIVIYFITATHPSLALQHIGRLMIYEEMYVYIPYIIYLHNIALKCTIGSHHEGISRHLFSYFLKICSRKCKYAFDIKIFACNIIFGFTQPININWYSSRPKKLHQLLFEIPKCMHLIYTIEVLLKSESEDIKSSLLIYRLLIPGGDPHKGSKEIEKTCN